VVATDPETGETASREVVATIVGHGEKNLVEVTVDVDGEAGDATETITATAEHPFWVDDHGRLLQPAAHGPWGEAPGWYDAADLDPGDQLRTPPATEFASSTSAFTSPQPRSTTSPSTASTRIM
jgi:hypothetical protein